MKNLLFCVYCVLGFSISLTGQVQKDSIHTILPDEDGPMVLRFEPHLDITANKKRALFKMERQYIDTLQVSEKKKQRLLRHLYKDIHDGSFEKNAITNTAFEDDMDK